jgi:hypothetical protein
VYGKQVGGPQVPLDWIALFIGGDLATKPGLETPLGDAYLSDKGVKPSGRFYEHYEQVFRLRTDTAPEGTSVWTRIEGLKSALDEERVSRCLLLRSWQNPV